MSSSNEGMMDRVLRRGTGILTNFQTAAHPSRINGIVQPTLPPEELVQDVQRQRTQFASTSTSLETLAKRMAEQARTTPILEESKWTASDQKPSRTTNDENKPPLPSPSEPKLQPLPLPSLSQMNESLRAVRETQNQILYELRVQRTMLRDLMMLFVQPEAKEEKENS